jgi:chemotaxis signal transduction protein
VLAVVDLRSLLGFEPLERREAARLLVAQSTVFDCRAGFLVDGLHGALALSPEGIGHAGASIDGRISGFLRGVVELEGRVLNLLDLEAVFRVDEMRRLQEG